MKSVILLGQLLPSGNCKFIVIAQTTLSMCVQVSVSTCTHNCCVCFSLSYLIFKQLILLSLPHPSFYSPSLSLSLSPPPPPPSAVGSPKEGSGNRMSFERRQSVAVMDGLSHPSSSSSSSSSCPPLHRQQSLQQAVSGSGEGSLLLNIMSNSAMSTGSNSGLRNVTVKKVNITCLLT